MKIIIQKGTVWTLYGKYRLLVLSLTYSLKIDASLIGFLSFDNDERRFEASFVILKIPLGSSHPKIIQQTLANGLTKGVSFLKQQFGFAWWIFADSQPFLSAFEFQAFFELGMMIS
jgi:hypothetical protein